MSKWKCENPNCKKPCYAEPPERCYPTGCLLSRNNTPHWNQMAEPVTNCNQLPKLTAEVFDRSDCPAWAQWAAVDESGTAFYYYEKPYARKHTFHSWDSMKSIDNKFDATDWGNSLIERPEKKGTLPDWCKVGEWIWYPEDMGSGRYLKITEIRGGGVYAKEKEDYDPDYLCFDLVRKYSKQARLRPYNAEEMLGLIGKVLTSNSRSTPFSFLVVYAEGDGSFIESYRFKYTAEELKDHFTIDGKPCGVLEYLENGEWVE